MKNPLSIVIFSAGFVAAHALCWGQSNVYSLNIPSFAERSGLTRSHSVPLTSPAPHGPDEVRVASYSHSVGAVSSCTEWYVSTNSLAKQPRWDGPSAEPPLSIGKACALALARVREQFPKVKSWTMQSLALRNLDPAQDRVYPGVWYYEISFAPGDPGLRKQFEEDASSCLTQIVLLDGTVVPPRSAKSE